MHISSRLEFKKKTLKPLQVITNFSVYINDNVKIRSLCSYKTFELYSKFLFYGSFSVTFHDILVTKMINPERQSLSKVFISSVYWIYS